MGDYAPKSEPDQPPSRKKQRLTIRHRGDLVVYSAGPWCGWRDIIGLFMVLLILSIILAAFVFLLYMLGMALEAFCPWTWLRGVLYFVVTAHGDFSMILICGLVILWLPYFLLYALSPKEFWLENGELCHTVRLLGFLKRKRRIPFERVMEIEVKDSNGAYQLVAVYELRMPKVVFVILAYWNERFTVWPLTLVNGIETKEEAEKIQRELLEVMTKAD